MLISIEQIKTRYRLIKHNRIAKSYFKQISLTSKKI